MCVGSVSDEAGRERNKRIMKVLGQVSESLKARFAEKIYVKIYIKNV